MEQFIMEYLMQIVLAIIGGLLAIAQLRARSHHAREIARLQSEAEGRKRDSDDRTQRHAQEILALKTEADQQKVQLEIIKEFAAGVPKNQETWQSVLDKMSARRLEGDKEIATAVREIAVTNRDNVKAIESIVSIIEIHTAAYGNLQTKLEDSLHTYVSSASATHKAVDSQKEELQDVNLAIGKLTTRIDDLITIDESHVIDEGKRHDSLKDDNREHNTQLLAIKTTLQTSNSILEKILKRMEGDTQPIPDLQTITENTEDKPLKSA